MSTGDLLLRVECYVAVRKALGYACRSEEKLLNNFVRFLELNGASGPIRAQTAIEWVCAPAHGPAPSGQTNRLRVVRGFLSHLQAFEFELQTSAPAGCSNQIPKVASGSSASLVRREDRSVRCPKEASGLRCVVGCFVRV